MESDSSKTMAPLLKSLENGQGIQHIINVAYKILGNPLIVNDTSYKLLAYTENTVTDDPLWNELVSLDTFSHETVNFFREELFINEVAYTNRISILKSGKLKYDRINAKIFDKDGIHIENLCVVACYKPFVPDDYRLIEKVCEVIAVEIHKSEFYQKIERVYQETCITKLIDGEIKNGILECDELNELYKELKPNLYVAVADISQYDHTLIHLGYFRDIFRSLQNEYKYYIYLNYIVIIISTDLTLDVKVDLNNLNEFFIKNNIFAGISSRFQNLFELQKYYRQALHALNYGIDVYKDQRIFKYDDFRIDHLLSSIKDGIKEDDICAPVTLEILEYDRENHTMYFDIFYNYMLYGRNIQIVSEQLRMNQDELYEQLKIIEKIFKIDWNNGNSLLNIFFSIKFLKNAID